MKNEKTRQLYTVLPSLKLFGHCALGETVIKDGAGLPFLTWPDGSPCSLANIYMLTLRDRPGRGRNQGLSRRGGRGGSIGDYASKISPLIRFCFALKIDFIALNDQLFTKMIRQLRRERDPANPAAHLRSETSLLSIGRVCIDFLQFVGRFHGDEHFVHEQGVIRVVEKQILVTSRSGRTYKRTFLHHHSLTVRGRRIHSRDPITETDVGQLRAAVNSIGSSRHLQLRRNMMLSLYEHTGARRGEIANLGVEDILSALRMKRPMLRLITLKLGGDEERFVPISRAVLSEAKKYINIARSKSMRLYAKSNRSRNGGKDHGILMVQERTGKPLGKYSLTAEISALRREANIDHQACGHMFRHAFITNLFVLLIKRHRFRHQDDFRNALLNSSQFVQEVMMWTGQKDPVSVERYINLAYARLDGYEETVTSVHIIRVNRIYDRAEEELLAELKNGLSPMDYALRLEELKRQRKADLRGEIDGADTSLDRLREIFLDDDD